MQQLRRIRLQLILVAERLQQLRDITVRLAAAAAVSVIASSPMSALGGGRLAATTAITAAATEISGPFAYGASLIMITGSAIAWWRHHHDMGAISNGALGTLFVAGTALGAASLMGFVPGVAGALI
jgi:hypothetical protein